MGQVSTGQVVYLDTNILIYLTEGNHEQKLSLRDLFLKFERASARFITSELVFTELLVHPIRTGNTELIQAYERLLSVLVEPIPVSRDVLVLAAKMRAETPSQKTPDAIHVATAILFSADVFVTGDRGIGNLPAEIQLCAV